MSGLWIIFQEDEDHLDAPENQRTWETPEAVLKMFDEGSDKEDCPHQIIWTGSICVGRIETAEKVVCCHIRKQGYVERVVPEEELTLVEPVVPTFKIHKGGRA